MAKLKLPDDAPATVGMIRRLRKELRIVDERVSDCFESFQAGDQDQSNFWDEHEDKINRLQRSVNRLRKRVEELE